MGTNHQTPLGSGWLDDRGPATRVRVVLKPCPCPARGGRRGNSCPGAAPPEKTDPSSPPCGPEPTGGGPFPTRRCAIAVEAYRRSLWIMDWLLTYNPPLPNTYAARRGRVGHGPLRLIAPVLYSMRFFLSSRLGGWGVYSESLERWSRSCPGKW